MHNPSSGTTPVYPQTHPIVASQVGVSTAVHDGINLPVDRPNCRIFPIVHSGWNTLICDVTQGLIFFFDWLITLITQKGCHGEQTNFLTTKLPLPVLDMRWQFCAITCCAIRIAFSVAHIIAQASHRNSLTTLNIEYGRWSYIRLYNTHL